MQTKFRQPGAATTEPTVRIDDGGPDAQTPRTRSYAGWPAGKLADVELHWTAGTMAGIKLMGFALWEARNADRINVTMPSRTYQVNGERRSFALVRAIEDSRDTAGLRALILEAWEMHQMHQVLAQPTSGPHRPDAYSYTTPSDQDQDGRTRTRTRDQGNSDQGADVPPLQAAAQAGTLIAGDYPCTNTITWGNKADRPQPAHLRSISDDDPAQAPAPPAAPRYLTKDEEAKAVEAGHITAPIFGMVDDQGLILPSAMDPARLQAQGITPPVTVTERCNRCGQPTAPAELQDHDLGGVYVRACAACRAILAQPIATRSTATRSSTRRPSRF